ncbi:MAG TPA: RsmE family RNA methyltransferase [Candidatus Solibacter sp.]|jgi:16S rRNA (uracil1498-N3)-methyltransferase|nr:RsmE family RNA methyltransferase [Candidatus Solibacter sp.]
MTRRRWIADRVEGDRAYLLGTNAAHLARVLRARAGQQFDIATQDAVRSGTIVSITAEAVEFALGALVESVALPEINVILSIFKFDRLEWAIEKLTELGVAQIVPAIARRTEPHLAKAAEKRVERWRKIAHEAAQQARRLTAPEILEPSHLKKAILEARGRCVVLSEMEETATLKSVLESARAPVTMAFGPEGGWAAEELQIFQERSWSSASLGSTILRAETAAIVAVAIAMAELSG